MRCPNCKQILSDNINLKMNFCPLCGKRLYDADKEYLLYISSVGQRDSKASKLHVFIDASQLYEINPGDGLLIRVTGGFHAIKFKREIRSKSIQLLVDSDYDIKAYFNSLTGLIETTINDIDGTEDGHTALNTREEELSKPVMVSDVGERGFDVFLGNDRPIFELKASSGFREGTLRLYPERAEFSSNKDLQKDITDYTQVVSVAPKMGSLDIQCEGNVHKIYSIPKDSYNEVMAFLNNRINDLKEN